MESREDPTAIVVVPATERVIPAAGQTPGMRREEAFVRADRWIGYVTAEPGPPGGWHHHGAYETYFYVLAGTLRLEFGPGGRRHVEARPGDFVFVPPQTVHRETTISSAAGAIVLVRVGRGPAVVNVDAPDPA